MRVLICSYMLGPGRNIEPAECQDITTSQMPGSDACSLVHVHLVLRVAVLCVDLVALLDILLGGEVGGIVGGRAHLGARLLKHGLRLIKLGESLELIELIGERVVGDDGLSLVLDGAIAPTCGALPLHNLAPQRLILHLRFPCCLRHLDGLEDLVQHRLAPFSLGVHLGLLGQEFRDEGDVLLRRVLHGGQHEGSCASVVSRVHIRLLLQGSIQAGHAHSVCAGLEEEIIRPHRLRRGHALGVLLRLNLLADVLGRHPAKGEEPLAPSQGANATAAANADFEPISS
mmetsp:Transcript_42848/g.91300  ORF Transcript_42848/g.91300 Transcript_42848/m.91300 type:complete len:286 (-) Transcript_42848:6-863(-)